MWVILTIIVAVIIIWIITSNNSDNEKIRNHNLELGGLKTKFSNFTYLMQKKYDFKLKYDDGRNVCFSKKIYDNKNNLGELTIGLKLDSYNTLLIYSNFKLEHNNNIINGINVSGFFDNDTQSLITCVNKSIEPLNVNLQSKHE